MSDIIAELTDIVGGAHVLTDPDVTASYAVDWTGRFAGETPLVVRPADTGEVAATLATLARHGLPCVPQGGNTGLVGGSVPLAGEAVVSLTRLSAIDPVDELAGQVTVGAGATLAAVRERARSVGLEVGVDLAPRDSCTIGGMIATNAGGINVVRYGAMRDQVVGIEVVLADGTVLTHLDGLEKDNTGYHLPGLLAGSEGTLGIVTRARLRLRPRLGERVTALLACETASDAVAATAHLRRTVTALHAIEVVFDRSMELVSGYLSAAPPTEGGAAWLVVEAAGTSDPTDELAGALEGCGEWVMDAAVATDGPGQRRLWQFRESITEAISAAGTPHKMDVTLPSSTLGRFVAEVPGCVASVDPDAVTYLFGHLGDGNVHVNVLGAGGAQPSGDVDGEVLRLVASMGGSISAEHGIGTAKREWLHLNRSAEEIDVFARVKAALDPDRLLNPHVLLPDGER